ncbi:MAG: DNA methyltransferase [Candidatus Bathyarchaeia archaeon]
MKGDIVLDPFCGCGTTLVAAQKLNRKWIGIDISPTACKLMKKRLQKEFKINVHVIRGKVDANYVKSLAPFEFQNWVIVDKFLGKASPRKSGDTGIDGYTPEILGAIQFRLNRAKASAEMWLIILRRPYGELTRQKGTLLPTLSRKEHYEKATRAKNQAGVEIILQTVQELIDGKVE